jgi:hypothetical protein
VPGGGDVAHEQVDVGVASARGVGDDPEVQEAAGQATAALRGGRISL